MSFELSKELVHSFHLSRYIIWSFVVVEDGVFICCARLGDFMATEFYWVDRDHREHRLDGPRGKTIHAAIAARPDDGGVWRRYNLLLSEGSTYVLFSLEENRVLWSCAVGGDAFDTLKPKFVPKELTDTTFTVAKNGIATFEINVYSLVDGRYLNRIDIPKEDDVSMEYLGIFGGVYRLFRHTAPGRGEWLGFYPEPDFKIHINRDVRHILNGDTGLCISTTPNGGILGFGIFGNNETSIPSSNPSAPVSWDRDGNVHVLEFTPRAAYSLYRIVLTELADTKPAK